MGCSALGTTEGEIIYPEDVASGVLSGHAYSVIDVFEIKAQVADENGDLKPKLEKLVRLRNPWGTFLFYLLKSIRKKGMGWCVVRWIRRAT